MNWGLLLSLVANSIILTIITTTVPSTAAGMVSGTVGLALTHAFEAMYIANKIVNPMLNGMRTIGNNAIRAFGGNDGSLEARLRANERLAPPKPPADPANLPTGAPNYGSHGDPSAGTRVMDPKLTRPMGSGGRPSGISATTQIGSNGNTKGTTNSSTKGTTKI